MRIWIAIGIFVGVILLGFLVFTLRITESPAPAADNKAATPALTGVTYTDTFKKGVHTIKGSAMVPTACTELNATSTVTDSGAIRIDLSASLDEGLCLKLLTKKTFTLTETADEDVHIELFANGSPIPE